MLLNITGFKKLILSLLISIVPSMAFATLPIQKIDLPTGAKLFFVEARTIPMVNIGIDFPGGFAHDPKDRIGVANFTSLLTSMIRNSISCI
jgi:zinc protease